MSPNEAANESISDVVFRNIYGGKILQKKSKPKYKIGQKVRISEHRMTFTKSSSTQRWTTEIFKITGIRVSNVPYYFLSDLKNEKIQGDAFWIILQIIVSKTI